MHQKTSLVIIFIVVVICVLNTNVFAANLTFKAFWDKGAFDIAADIPAGTGWTNNNSYWLQDDGNLGYMSLHPDGPGEDRQKPWFEYGYDIADMWGATGGTIMFWYKPSESPNFTRYGLFFGMEDWIPGQTQPFIEGRYDASNIQFEIKYGATHLNSQTATLNPGQWYHLAFVFDLTSNVSKIYLNGQLLGSLAITGQTQAFDPSAYAGTGEGRWVIAGKHIPFLSETITAEGGYDQFVMYDGPLSGADIMNDYLTSGLRSLQILTLTLPRGVVGQSYSETLQGQGGTPPYTWQLLAGSLPNGLSLSSGGVISGTPTTVETASFTVELQDNNSASVQKSFDLGVITESVTASTVLENAWISASDESYSIYSSETLDSPNWVNRFSLEQGSDDIYAWYDEGDSVNGIANPGVDAITKRFYKAESDFNIDPPDTRTKKLIEWGWHMPSPLYLVDNIETMEQMPFHGTMIRIAVPPPGDEYFSKSMFWGANLTYAMVQAEAEALQVVNFNKFTENYLMLRGTASPTWVEWFDNFSTVINNFTLAAKIAYEGGLKGFMIDMEHYGACTLYNYYDRKYTSKTWEEYEAKVFQRGQEIMQAINSEFPAIQIQLYMSYPVVYWGMLDRGHTMLEEAEMGLMVPFLDGLVTASDSGTTFVQYHASGTFYVRDEDSLLNGFGYNFQIDTIDSLSSYPLQVKAKMQQGLVMFLLRYTYPDLDTSEVWEHAIRTALSITDRYAWIYTERVKWWDSRWDLLEYPFVPQAFIDAQEASYSLQIRTPVLTKAAVNQDYSRKIYAILGAPPYTYSVVSGSLPTGISLDPNTGMLTGTPSVVGTSNFTLKVTDSETVEDTAALSLEVIAPFRDILPAVKVEWDSLLGEQYQVQWSADGATNWQTISPTIIGNGSANTWYDHGDTGSRPDPWLQSQPRGHYKVTTVP